MNKFVSGIISFLIGMVVGWVCLNLTSMDSALATMVSVIVALCAYRAFERLADKSSKKTN